MVPALIAAIAAVVIAIVSMVGQLLSSRNDRTLIHLEVDLLKKLDPKEEAAKTLNGVIEARIQGWGKRVTVRRTLRQMGAVSLLQAVASVSLAMVFVFALTGLDRKSVELLLLLGSVSFLFMGVAFLLQALYSVREYLRSLKEEAAAEAQSAGEKAGAGKETTSP